MPKLHYTRNIDAAPDRAWAVVGDLTGVDKWIPGCTTATMEENVRVCTFANGATQREAISDYSEKQRLYRYSVTSGPLPLKSNRGTLSVEAEGNGSRIVWDAEIEVPDPAHEDEMTTMLDGAYKQVLDLLEQRIVESL